MVGRTTNTAITSHSVKREGIRPGAGGDTELDLQQNEHYSSECTVEKSFQWRKTNTQIKKIIMKPPQLTGKPANEVGFSSECHKHDCSKDAD